MTKFLLPKANLFKIPFSKKPTIGTTHTHLSNASLPNRLFQMFSLWNMLKIARTDTLNSGKLKQRDNDEQTNLLNNSKLINLHLSWLRIC